MPRATTTAWFALWKLRPTTRFSSLIDFATLDFRFTKWQTARGARPDAIRGGDRYLIKNVGTLRLTWQIRLLAYAAYEEHGRLILVIPTGSKVSPELRAFVARDKKHMRISRG